MSSQARPNQDPNLSDQDFLKVLFTEATRVYNLVYESKAGKKEALQTLRAFFLTACNKRFPPASAQEAKATAQNAEPENFKNEFSEHIEGKLLELANTEFKRIAVDASGIHEQIAAESKEPVDHQTALSALSALNDLKTYHANLQQLFDPDQGKKVGVKIFTKKGRDPQYEVSAEAGAATRALSNVKGNVFAVSGIASMDAPESTPAMHGTTSEKDYRDALYADHKRKHGGILSNNLFKKTVGFRLEHAAENAFQKMKSEVSAKLDLAITSTNDGTTTTPEVKPFLHLHAFSRGCITAVLAHNKLHRWFEKECKGDISAYYKSFVLVDPIRGPLLDVALAIKGEGFNVEPNVVKFIHTTDAIDHPLYRPRVYRPSMEKHLESLKESLKESLDLPLASVEEGIETKEQKAELKKKIEAAKKYASAVCTNPIIFPGMKKSTGFKPKTSLVVGRHSAAMHNLQKMREIREIALAGVEFKKDDSTFDFRGTSESSWTAGVGVSQTNARFVTLQNDDENDVSVDVVRASPGNKVAEKEYTALAACSGALFGVASGSLLAGAGLLALSSPAVTLAITGAAIGIAALAPYLIPALIVLAVVAAVVLIPAIALAAQSISLAKHQDAVDDNYLGVHPDGPATLG